MLNLQRKSVRDLLYGYEWKRDIIKKEHIGPLGDNLYV